MDSWCGQTIRGICKHVGHVNAVHNIISKPRDEVVDKVVDGILPQALDVDKEFSPSKGHVRRPCGSCVAISGVVKEILGHGKELAPLAPEAGAEGDAAKELCIRHVVIVVCQHLGERSTCRFGQIVQFWISYCTGLQIDYNGEMGS